MKNIPVISEIVLTLIRSNMNHTFQTIIKDLLTDAKADWLIIDKITKNSLISVTRLCLHSKLLAEKYLRIFLASYEISTSKKHTIEYLLAESGKIDKDFLQINTKKLSDYGVGIEAEGKVSEPSIDEAMEYKDNALKIKTLVEKRIKSIK